MKKRIRVLLPILVIVAMLASMLVMTVPVMASAIQLAKNTDPLTPNKYYVGDTIHYVLNVTNPSSNTHTNYLDFVEDWLPDGSTVTLATNVIQAPGVSNTYYYDYVVDENDLELIGGRWKVVNVLHAAGTDSLGDIIKSTTSKGSIILRPAINITKTVDCDGDGNFADEETTVGPDTPTWRIVVTNTGYDPVYNITVTDTNGQNYTIPLLAVSASDTHTYTGAAINVTTTNTATATGVDEIGGNVGPVSDNATNIIIHPDIDIEKLVSVDGGSNWFDADSAPGPTAVVGNNVSFKVIVCNNGTTPLTNISVNDTDFTFTGVATSLAAGNCDESDVLIVPSRSWSAI